MGLNKINKFYLPPTQQIEIATKSTSRDYFKIFTVDVGLAFAYWRVPLWRVKKITEAVTWGVL